MIFTFTVIFYTYASLTGSFFKIIDSEIINLMFQIRGQKTVSNEIVIIDIDEKSIKKLGQWPWPRNIIAKLIENIQKQNPKVIGLDIFFPEKDRSSPANILKDFNVECPQINQIKNQDFDKILADTISKGSIVMGYIFDFFEAKPGTSLPFSSSVINISKKNIRFSDLHINTAKGIILNIPNLSASETEGFINIFPNSSGSIKKAPLLIKYKNIPFPSLSMELFRIYSDITQLTIVPSSQNAGKEKTLLGIIAGETFIPTDIDGQMFINFKGFPFSYKYIPACDMFLEKNNHIIKDKIVIIGTSAAGLSDLKSTPFSPSFPGVEIHATIIDNILNKDFFKYDKYTELGISYFIIIFIGIIITLILIYSGPFFAAFITLSAIAGTFFINYFIFFKNNHIAGFSYPVLSLMMLCIFVTIFNYFFKEKEKKFIQNAFSHYVSHEVVEEIIKSPNKLSLSGETKFVSIMFGDIRGFTTISEKLKPYELGELLNGYFSSISEIIMANKGVVDKFIGDAVMAFWGAPVENEDHALNAVYSVFEIFEKLKELNVYWEKRNFPKVNLGMGINSGLVRVGNFGSNTRFDYTVIGDHVNLASRVEGLNKFYSSKILITEFTNSLVSKNVLSRKLDWVKVKGKNKPVEIYEPLQLYPFDLKLIEDVARFHIALDEYKKGNFNAAKEKILNLKQKKSEYIYDLYIKRIDSLLQDPPKDWDGVYEFTTK